MLLYWQLNTEPQCEKQEVLQKTAKTPQTCTARRESRYSYTATIGTAFHIQHRSIQTKVDKVTPTTIEALTPISAQRPTSNTEEYKNKPTRSHIPTTKKFSKKSPRGVQRGAALCPFAVFSHSNVKYLCGFPQPMHMHSQVPAYSRNPRGNYLPIQNLENISLTRSSPSDSPRIRPKLSYASVRSME